MVLTHIVSSHLTRAGLPVLRSLEVIFGLGANFVPFRSLFVFLKVCNDSFLAFLATSLYQRPCKVSQRISH